MAATCSRYLSGKCIGRVISVRVVAVPTAVPAAMAASGALCGSKCTCGCFCGHSVRLAADRYARRCRGKRFLAGVQRRRRCHVQVRCASAAVADAIGVIATRDACAQGPNRGADARKRSRRGEYVRRTRKGRAIRNSCDSLAAHPASLSTVKHG